MTRFNLAVRAGMNAADSAKRNKQEIRETLSSLAKSVEQATDGRVTVLLAKGLRGSEDTSLNSIMSFILATPLFDAIVLKVVDSNPSKKIQIAKFKETTTGFPCTLSVSSDEYICTDRESLEQVLSKIISTAEVGLAIAELQAKPSAVADTLRISQPTGEPGSRTVVGMVNLKSTPGRVIEKPFVGRAIRQVSAKRVSTGSVRFTLGGAETLGQKKTGSGKITRPSEKQVAGLSKPGKVSSSGVVSTAAMSNKKARGKPLSKVSRANPINAASKPAAPKAAVRKNIKA